MPTDELASAVAQLPPGWAGQFFEVVESTQDEARAAAAARAAPSRSIFVADFQRSGRGRQGRQWLAQPGVALMLSILFREAAGPAPAPLRFTTLASVSLAEAIEEVLPTLRPAIKWPNDLLLEDRKVAGILAETSSVGQATTAIVGIGLNVNNLPAELENVGPAATSLRVAVAQNRDIDRGQVLLALIRRMDAWLGRPPAELPEAWQARLWGRGQRLRLLDLGREEQVVVLGADPDGSLRVRLADGTERHTTTGELIV